MATSLLPMSPPRGRSGAAALRRRWVVAVTTGELVGFIPPAIVGTSLAAVGAPDWAMVAGLVMAGSVEGLAVGVAQARVLRTALPAVDGVRWIGATALAAAVAWAVGMGGGAVMGAEVLPVAVALSLLVPAWALGLLGMGWGQWRVLRSAVPASGGWVAWTAVAWAVGVAIPVIALSAVPSGWPPAAHVVVGVVAAVAMGAVVGAITARPLVRYAAR